MSAEDQTRDVNILAASSKLQLAKQQGESVRDAEKETPPDFSKMVGKTFVKRTPGIYVGATYEVKALAGDMFHVIRNDPAHGIFEYTIKCQIFHELMKMPEKRWNPSPSRRSQRNQSHPGRRTNEIQN